MSEALGEFLDASKIETLHLCPQKFAWRYEQHLVPSILPGPGAAEFGFAIHKALESLYLGTAFEQVTCPCPALGCDICSGNPIPNLYAKFLIYYPWDPEDPKDPRTRSIGLTLLREYVNKWRVEGFRTLAVEVPFSIQFGEFDYVGRIDLVAQRKDDNSIFPIDHKTTTRFGDMFDLQFKLSIQKTGYMVGLERVLGVPVSEGMINAMRVTTRIQDESFHRLITTRTPEEKVRWEREVREAFEHIKYYREQAFWPRHAPFSCSAYMRRCDYYSLCTSGESAQRALIEAAYERKPWDPTARD